MTSIIRVEVLSGGHDDSPLCYLLQVDDSHFLLDCGWDERFDMEYIENVKRRIPFIDAVLLSYADQPHLGALPYLVGKCGLNCPVYATVPVYKMGQMFMYDWYLGHQNVEDFKVFTLDDVDHAFDKIQQLKYNQNVSLKGRSHGIQITPLPAGHMIGGTVWKISRQGEEEIVYAVDFNHKKERHLNGCTFEGIGRPSLLITDAHNALYQQPRRKQRDEALLTNILQTVRNGGNVLIVIDTAGRVLELAQLLDQLWHNAEAGLITYSLVIMNNVAYNVMEFAKSQVEWMSDKILRSFEEGRFNPFQFRHVVVVHSMQDLRKVRPPMVVLASSPDMESGFARELFTEWCSNEKNCVLLTNRSTSGTLARRLIDHYCINFKYQTEKKTEADGHSFVQRRAKPPLIELIKRRVRLEGLELDDYVKQKKQKEQEVARHRLEAQRRLSRIDAEDSGSSDEEDTKFSDHPYDIMLKFDAQQKASCFKQSRRQYPMFPYVEEKMKWDDYGAFIRPEDYMIVETSVGGEVKKEEPGLKLEDRHPELSADIPTKCISYRQTLDVKCKLEFIDFEGRSDNESIKKLLAQIKPKQLVLIHGQPEAIDYLRKFCSTFIDPRYLFHPDVNELADCTVESHIYQVMLTDVLMTQLKFQLVRDAELSWVDAKVQLRQSQTGEKSETPCLDILPAADVPPHSAVFVNDPKLSDLKAQLILHGFQAEFSAGVLYVNNVVAIRRTEAGRFHMEGTVCDDYFNIRQMLYNQFAIV